MQGTEKFALDSHGACLQLYVCVWGAVNIHAYFSFVSVTESK
jgi:hypothetical protein